MPASRKAPGHKPRASKLRSRIEAVVLASADPRAALDRLRKAVALVVGGES